MRIVPHDLAILAGAGFGFVGIDDEVARPAILAFLRHEGPFQAGRKTRSPTTAQAGGLHLVDDPVAALVDHRLGAIPGAAAACAFQAPVVQAIEIPEDAILVVEHDYSAFRSALAGSRSRLMSSPSAWSVRSRVLRIGGRSVTPALADFRSPSHPAPCRSSLSSNPRRCLFQSAP